MVNMYMYMMVSVKCNLKKSKMIHIYISTFALVLTVSFIIDYFTSEKYFYFFDL